LILAKIGIKKLLCSSCEEREIELPEDTIHLINIEFSALRYLEATGAYKDKLMSLAFGLASFLGIDISKFEPLVLLLNEDKYLFVICKDKQTSEIRGFVINFKAKK